jgi:hypothetical protein
MTKAPANDAEVKAEKESENLLSLDDITPLADLHATHAEDAHFRKSRSTKGVTEAYYFILSLAWNDIVTNGGKLSVRQQEESIKIKCRQWADALHREFPHVPLKPEVTSSILNIEISMDSGNGMIRKAKEMIHYVNNVLNPVWKDMTSSATPAELEEALLNCRKVAWVRNEHDRKKKRKAFTSVESVERPFDASWIFKEWLTFRYLGMPAGDGGCLRIFQATFPGSAAFQSQKKFSVDSKSRELVTSRRVSSRSEVPVDNASDEDDETGEKLVSDKASRQCQLAYWRQSLYTAEKNRLESLISLSEKLNMPSEATEAHLRALYAFLLVPCSAEEPTDEEEREAKSQKIGHCSTPTSAAAMSSKSSTSSSSAGEC